jgi:hypothetical protein
MGRSGMWKIRHVENPARKEKSGIAKRTGSGTKAAHSTLFQ